MSYIKIKCYRIFAINGQSNIYIPCHWYKLLKYRNEFPVFYRPIAQINDRCPLKIYIRKKTTIQ